MRQADALVVGARAIMVVKIALLCFVPLGDSRLAFTTFLLDPVRMPFFNLFF